MKPPRTVSQSRPPSGTVMFGPAAEPEKLRLSTPPLAARVDAFERKLLRDTLRLTQGNVARAAEMLQMPRKTVYDKLQRHGLTPGDFAARPGAGHSSI